MVSLEIKQLHVFLLNNQFFPIGGTAIRTLNFARAIKGCVRKVHIITWQPEENPPDKEEMRHMVQEGIAIDVLCIKHQFLKKHLRFIYAMVLSFEYLIFARKIVQKEKTCIIQCANELLWLCIIIKRIIGRPIIEDLHSMPSLKELDMFPQTASAFQQFLSRTMLRMTQGSVEEIICPTEELRRFLISWGVPNCKVRTISNIVFMSKDGSGKSSKEIRAELGLGSEITVIGFHGVLKTDYNVDALYQLRKISRIVSKELRNRVKFIIMGHYERILVQDENFVYTGYVKNLNEYLNAVDFAVVPIFKNSLGIRSRLLDYFAMSVPVITTPVGITGMPYARNSGAIIVRDNIEELAQSTIELACSPDKLEGMRKESRKMIEHFRPEEIAKELLSTYTKAIENYSHST